MRNNARIILIWNRVYPNQMLSLAALDFYHGLSQQQRDNAGSRNSRLVTSTRPLLTRLSLATPVDTSLATSATVSSSVPITQNTNTNTRWKHYLDN